MNTANTEIKPEKSRFEIIQNDTIIDHDTDLMWTRDNVGGKRHTFDEAKTVCEKLELGEHSDWRLPAIQELLTLVDYERNYPTIDTDAFNCESSWYWTSTPYAPSPGDRAWYVFFDYGDSYWCNHYNYGFVRAVRGGQ